MNKTTMILAALALLATPALARDSQYRLIFCYATVAATVSDAVLLAAIRATPENEECGK